MKLFGKTVGVNIDYVIFERSGGNIVFHLVPIMDMDEFQKYRPIPEPPIMFVKGGVKLPDKNNPAYITKLDSFVELKYAWIVINTIKSTPGLEWDQVKLDDPNTWPQWKNELTSLGLTTREIMHLWTKVLQVNTLDEAKLDEARKDFIHGLQEQASD